MVFLKNAREGEAIRPGGQVRWRDKRYKWYYQELRSPLLMEWSTQVKPDPIKSNLMKVY